jgi:hypothetical protein
MGAGPPSLRPLIRGGYGCRQAGVCCILQGLSQIYVRLQVSPEPQAEGLDSIQHGFVARCRLAQVDHGLQGSTKGYCFIVGPYVRRLGQGLARRQQGSGGVATVV